jgi:hypothetical protein
MPDYKEHPFFFFSWAANDQINVSIEYISELYIFLKSFIIKVNKLSIIFLKLY